MGSETMILIDLPDDRRAAKPWLPQNDGRDVTDGLVELRPYPLATKVYPACTRHGAMLRVMRERKVYRCGEERCGVGAEVAEEPQ